jgi:AraC-like DNA-binding protein
LIFENEIFNINSIENVIYYKPKFVDKYKGTLPTHELIYYCEGESTITFSGCEYEMKPDTIIYLPKGIENNDYSIKVKKEVRMYNIYFHTDDNLPLTPVKISVKSDEVKVLFKKLFQTWISKNDGYYYKSMGYFYNIAELLKKQQTYSNSKSFKSLANSEEYMFNHYCDYKFNFTEFVNLSGLSYSYFKKLFVRKYGVPPVKYINRLKINRACELLQTNKFRVGEIAEICGFENTYYFSSVFKNIIGVSPKHYANNTNK